MKLVIFLLLLSTSFLNSEVVDSKFNIYLETGFHKGLFTSISENGGGINLRLSNSFQDKYFVSVGISSFAEEMFCISDPNKKKLLETFLVFGKIAKVYDIDLRIATGISVVNKEHHSNDPSFIGIPVKCSIDFWKKNFFAPSIDLSTNISKNETYFSFGLNLRLGRMFGWNDNFNKRKKHKKNYNRYN